MCIDWLPTIHGQKASSADEMVSTYFGCKTVRLTITDLKFSRSIGQATSITRMATQINVTMPAVVDLSIFISHGDNLPYITLQMYRLDPAAHRLPRWRKLKRLYS